MGLDREFLDKKVKELKWNVAIVNIILYHNNYCIFHMLLNETRKYYSDHLIGQGMLCVSKASLKEYLKLFCEKGILRIVDKGYAVINPEEWYFLFSKQYIEKKKIDERCSLERTFFIKSEYKKIVEEMDKTAMKNGIIAYLDPCFKKIKIDMMKDRNITLRSLNIKHEWENKSV